MGRDSYNDFEQYLTKQMNESFKPLPRKREHGNINNNSRYYRHFIRPLMKIYERGKVQRKVVKQYLEILLRQNEEKSFRRKVSPTNREDAATNN